MDAVCETKDGGGRLSVFDDALRTAPIVCGLRDEFLKDLSNEACRTGFSDPLNSLTPRTWQR